MILTIKEQEKFQEFLEKNELVSLIQLYSKKLGGEAKCELFESAADQIIGVAGSFLSSDQRSSFGGIISLAYSMMFALPEALDVARKFNSEFSETRVFEIAKWKGDFGVVKSVLSKHPDWMSSFEYQQFLVESAIPHMRMQKLSESSNLNKGILGYELDLAVFNQIKADLNIPCEHAVKQTLLRMQQEGNRNYAKQALLSKELGWLGVVKPDLVEIANDRVNYISRRDIRSNLEQVLANSFSEGDLARSKRRIVKQLQKGDSNELFPLASNIFLVEEEGIAVVYKENLRQYLDFSRVGGYSQEKEILERVDNPNIVRYFGTYDIEGVEFLRLKFIEGTCLSKYTHKNELLDLMSVVKIITTIANTIDYLGSEGIVYNDVKSTNFICVSDSSGTIEDVIMYDFGMSRLLEPNDLTSEGHVPSGFCCRSVLSTPKYIPPEMALEFKSYKHSDVFQLGILFYELLTGEHPFSRVEFKQGDAYRESEVLMYGLANAYNEPNLNCDKLVEYEELGDLIGDMLIKNPTERISMQDVSRRLGDYQISQEHVSKLNCGGEVKNELWV
ncbi:protein kinase [Candidatus Woesearchaeota archaeon]|nr:protein kinase [Candidatus Woesearchaeota archaeon]